MHSGNAHVHLYYTGSLISHLADLIIISSFLFITGRYIVHKFNINLNNTVDAIDDFINQIIDTPQNSQNSQNSQEIEDQNKKVK